MTIWPDEPELRPVSRFHDSRGTFTVLHRDDRSPSSPFVQDNHSRSRSRHTVRGIHLQLPPYEQGKVVTVLRGRLLDAVVDLRPGSPRRGTCRVFELGADDDRHLWIPPGFGHGFCTLDDDTEVFYKVDAPYRPDLERTLAWDDPTVAVPWPSDLDHPLLSAKDAEGADLATVVAAIDAAGAEARS